MKTKAFLLLVISFCLAPFSYSQVWSGILSPSRAVDWSGAGVPGGIPTRTVQCGSTIAAYGTINSPASSTAINNAITACPAGEFVSLGSGTFYLSDPVSFGTTNNVTLRGQGANSTFLVFNNSSSFLCPISGLAGGICANGSVSYVGGEQNWATWTAGYKQGSTQITLSNSLNVTAGSTLIILDQKDEPQDTGNIWNCVGSDGPCGGFTAGFARTDDTCTGSYCAQQQQVLVTACSPSCNNSGSTTLTISPGLYMNNWRAAQNPGAWWATRTAAGMGVEDLSVDLTDAIQSPSAVVIFNCYGCWAKGIRSVDAGRNHVYVYGSSHSTVMNNYLYQSQAHASVAYAIELTSGASDNLVVNNICQQVTDSCPSNTSGGAGNVAAYNFAINDIYTSPGWFQPNDYEHAGGSDFWLREGNISLGLITDNVHGTHHFTTVFRNWFKGYQATCDGSPCVDQTIPIQGYAASRYFNIIGNALGWPGRHTNYICKPSSTVCTMSDSTVFVLGYTGNEGGVSKTINGFCLNVSCSQTGNYDPLTYNSIMLWGNYDTANNGVRFNSSEVPSNFGDTTGTPSIYVNPVPSSQTLPASFFMTAKPSWWGSLPWPAIGPDVTGGTVTAGSGPASGLGGHVNMNPAMACYLNVMGGAPDGSGGLLSFNETACYSQVIPPAPPTDLSAIVN